MLYLCLYYVKKMGFESDENYIDNYIKSLISISNSYYVFQDNQLKKNEKFLLLDLEREKKKFINKSRKFWPAENLNILYIDYKKDNNTYKVCSNISNCRFENYDLEDIVKFLSSSKVSNKKIQYSFVNYARNDYSDRVKLKKKILQ